MTTPDAALPDGPGRSMTPWCAVIVNPTRAVPGVDDVEQLVAHETERAGWAPPTIWETTAAETGALQAREAVDAGASLVVVAGGDGTTRAVAGVLAGTGVPMGVLPMGTGNLLARNLDIPLNDGEAAADVVMNGATRAMDLCRVRVLRPSGRVDTEASVVMLGMGFDAEVVEDARDDMKRAFGWGAYVASGLRRLVGRRNPVRIWQDDEAPQIVRVRSVLVATAGSLTGGVTLLPDARLDDGKAEIVTVSPRSLAGWLGIVWWAVRGARGKNRLVKQVKARKVRIDARWPLPTQVDGDAIGDAIRLDIEVEVGALLVRVPESADRPAQAIVG